MLIVKKTQRATRDTLLAHHWIKEETDMSPLVSALGYFRKLHFLNLSNDAGHKTCGNYGLEIPDSILGLRSYSELLDLLWAQIFHLPNKKGVENYVTAVFLSGFTDKTPDPMP